MSEVNDTHLPGIGTRRDFLTEDGKRVGVISHFNGRRSLLLYDGDDPDSCRDSVSLSETESRILAALLRDE